MYFTFLLQVSRSNSNLLVLLRVWHYNKQVDSCFVSSRSSAVAKLHVFSSCLICEKCHNGESWRTVGGVVLPHQYFTKPHTFIYSLLLDLSVSKGVSPSRFFPALSLAYKCRSISSFFTDMMNDDWL